jgi:chromosome segregation ATPase
LDLLNSNSNAQLHHKADEIAALESKLESLQTGYDKSLLEAKLAYEKEILDKASVINASEKQIEDLEANIQSITKAKDVIIEEQSNELNSLSTKLDLLNFFSSSSIF